MTRTPWRTLSLILLLFALIHWGHARDSAAGLDDRPVDTHNEMYESPGSAQQIPLEETNTNTPGSGAVQQASAILYRIKPATSRLARLTKPKGVLGNAAYYAKEAFVLLFMNAPEPSDSVTKNNVTPTKLTGPLANAVRMLKEVALDEVEPNRDALWLLAEMNFHGNFTHPRNYTQAFQYYDMLAFLDGNSSAQHMLGFMYATGIGRAVEKDQARAMLYHKFAADAGDTRSQMTLAYRHHAGIGTPRNCDEAVKHYKKVAQKAVDFYLSGPPGGHVLVTNSYRIADEDGGFYGEGASVSSSGVNAKQGGPTSDAYADLDDVMEYLDFQSRKGDIRATFNMAKLYYDGSRGLKRDMRVAKELFMHIARMYWPANGKVKDDLPSNVEKLAPRAAGYLGRMFLRGEGMEQSYTKAKIWFQRGITNGDALSQYSMGLMYKNGLGVQQDTNKAAEYFAAAADHDLAVAQTNLGILFLDQGEVATARSYFELAIRSGHIEAYYYLAELTNQGLGRDRSCAAAALYYKTASEKPEILHTSFIEANEAYENGDMETALIAYMMAAEQGFENAQANVAFILDQSQPRYSLPSILPFLKQKATTVSDAVLALVYFTRSARQQNYDSLVKMGDYYLDGLSTPVPSPENAAACYQAAAENMQSAQAMWNLGWMHENGVGLEQDFHLAKRFYDQALETNKEAYLPVKLSLIKLRARSWWNGVSGGTINSIRDEPSKSSLLFPCCRKIPLTEPFSKQTTPNLLLMVATLPRSRRTILRRPSSARLRPYKPASTPPRSRRLGSGPRAPGRRILRRLRLGPRYWVLGDATHRRSGRCFGRACLLAE